VLLHIKCNRPLSSVLYCSSKKQFVTVDTKTFLYSGPVPLGQQNWLRGPGPKMQVTTSMACSGITLDSSSASYAILLSHVHWQQHTMNQVRSSCLVIPYPDKRGSHKFRDMHKATSEWHYLGFCFWCCINHALWHNYYNVKPTNCISAVIFTQYLLHVSSFEGLSSGRYL
jgi:hypothetical protein